jgi:hypothetical protein
VTSRGTAVQRNGSVVAAAPHPKTTCDTIGEFIDFTSALFARNRKTNRPNQINVLSNRPKSISSATEAQRNNFYAHRRLFRFDFRRKFNLQTIVATTTMHYAYMVQVRTSACLP